MVSILISSYFNVRDVSCEILAPSPFLKEFLDPQPDSIIWFILQEEVYNNSNCYSLNDKYYSVLYYLYPYTLSGKVLCPFVFIGGKHKTQYHFLYQNVWKPLLFNVLF